MLLKEWEIWDTYATYFLEPIKALDNAAINLVESGLFEGAFVSEGRFYWRHNSTVVSASINMSLGSSRSSMEFRIKPAAPEENYPREAMFQSIYLRFAEIKQFRQGGQFPARYIRGHLGECVLTADKYHYLVYPIVKIFETGVMLVELRIGSPDAKMTVRDFVAEFVNLYKRDFGDVLVPPALRRAGQHAYALSDVRINPVLTRVGSFLLDRELRKYLKLNTEIRKSGDFDFELAHLWGELREHSNTEETHTETHQTAPFTISDLATTIFSAVSVSLNGLRSGASLLVRPNSVMTLGDAWLGRPHVHLVRFDEQAATVKGNEVKFRKDFGEILSGIDIRGGRPEIEYMPANSRSFNDFGAYITKAATLWVWTRRGLQEQKKWAVPNRGHLIYFNQSICEVLEYGHMLHRRLFQLVANRQSSEAALTARDNLVHLRVTMNEVSGYGEITDMLIRGWNELGVKSLQEAIADMIDIRQVEASM